MRLPARPSAVLIFAALAPGASLLLALAGWPHAPHAFELFTLLLAVVLISAHWPRRSSLHQADTMQPSFVLECTALLLLGLPLALFVAAAGEIAHGLAQPSPRGRAGRLLTQTAMVLIALQAAGSVHAVLGGTVGHFVWPWQAGPLAAAVLTYCVLRSMTVRWLVPLLSKEPVDPDWSSHALRAWPPYALGASVAVALTEVAARGRWDLLFVLALPLYYACQAYCGTLERADEDHRRGEVMDAFVQGMAVVDRAGEVTLWSDTLERLVGCQRGQALGRSLVQALPALSRTEVPAALQDVLASRVPRTLPRVAVALATGRRVLDVRILPVEGGATLLWHDVTATAREEGAASRAEERLVLAAEAASDGLWEWDLRSQECFFSGRWRAMVGLVPEPGPGRPEDWLTRVHPDDVRSLRETIRTHLAGQSESLQHEHRLRHEDGTYRWFACRGVAARGPGGRAFRLAGALAERPDSALGPLRAQAVGLADPLTGLANRTVFLDRLGLRLAEFKRRPDGDRFAVLYLDLDRFKVVNDSLGHLVGDELLTGVSRRLETCLRPSDLLARLGGDEFAVLLASLGNEAQANTVAFRIQEALGAPFSIAGREVFTTASIGIAIALPQYASPDEIMRDADTAMYHAKTSGKARHELFDAEMHARVRDRLGLESDLRHAVGHDAFDVHFQPIVLLATGKCVGFESLIRWQRNGEAVSPATFVPLAEELGLIEPLGTWVLRAACRMFADWQRRFPGQLEYITVNVSSRQLVHQNFLGVVEKAVADADLRPSQLRLEITETALMENPKLAAALLHDLRDFGVKIYLDDFGTGYSSLSHLHKLPVDALKIDRSFVKSLERSDRPIVESILALARTLNTSVVAEGIETDAQAVELERLGCTHAQGYLFSRPLAVDAVEELLQRNEVLGPKRVPGPKAPAGDAGVFGASGHFAWPDGSQGQTDAAAEATLAMTRALSELRPAG